MTFLLFTFFFTSKFAVAEWLEKPDCDNPAFWENIAQSVVCRNEANAFACSNINSKFVSGAVGGAAGGALSATAAIREQLKLQYASVFKNLNTQLAYDRLLRVDNIFEIYGDKMIDLPEYEPTGRTDFRSLKSEAKRLEEDEKDLEELKKSLKDDPGSDHISQNIKDLEKRISARKNGGYFYGQYYSSVDQIKERMAYKLKAIEDLVNLDMGPFHQIRIENYSQLTDEHVEKARQELEFLVTKRNLEKLKTEPLLSGVKKILVSKLHKKFEWSLRTIGTGDLRESFEPLIKEQSAVLARQLKLPTESITRVVADTLSYKFLDNLHRIKDGLSVGTDTILAAEAVSGLDAKLAEGAISQASKVGTEKLAPALAKSAGLGAFAGVFGGAAADILLAPESPGCGSDKILHHFLPVAGPECQPNLLTVNNDKIKRMVAMPENERKATLKQHPELCSFYKEYYLNTVKPKLEYSCVSDTVANAKYVDPFSGKIKKVVLDKSNDGNGNLQFFEEKDHGQFYKLFNMSITNKGDVTLVSMWDQFLNQGYKHIGEKDTITKLSSTERKQLASSVVDFKAVQVFLPLLKECCQNPKEDSSCRRLDSFKASGSRKNHPNMKSSR